MPKVFVTRRISGPGLGMLKAAGFRVVVHPGTRPPTRAQLLKGAKGCDALLTLLTDHIDDAVFDAAGPQLKIVSNYTVGFDNFDLAAFKRRGVLAANTAGSSNTAVAEHACALMFAVAKRLLEGDRLLRAGKYRGWDPDLLPGMELSGKTLGIIGLGRIGSGLAHRAHHGLGMKVLYHDVVRNEAFENAETAAFVGLDELLKRSDVVSLHVPLLPSTRHLIDAKKLRAMKKTAILINTSRGPVVDEKALVAALKAKRIAGAGIDVYEFEPRLAPGLAKLPNAVLTPHTASSTKETRAEMSRMAAQAIIDVLAGRTPPNLVPLP
ncbi:MAG TPA: D-glycerate dehydrogenase [Patescibacteria group bacterium]|nr:D-glycerate dehydrogenase [Patescibacteria group bacterium]